MNDSNAPAVVRVAARTTHGEIVRDGMGVASQAGMLDTRPKGPGTRVPMRSRWRGSGRPRVRSSTPAT